MHFQVTNIKRWAALLLALFVFTAASTHLYIQDPLWAPHFYLQWRKYHKKVKGNRTNRIRIKTSRQLLVSARPFSICVPGRRAWQTTFPSKTFLNLCLVHSSFFSLFFFFFLLRFPMISVVSVSMSFFQRKISWTSYLN